MDGFNIKTAHPKLKAFDSAVIEAAGIQDVRQNRFSSSPPPTPLLSFSFLRVHPLLLTLASKRQPSAREIALKALTSHPTFRAAHQREDHFIPLYIAAGAGACGEGKGSKVLSRIYGQSSFAFGL